MERTWPNGKALAISITLMCEAGGEVWPGATGIAPLAGVPLGDAPRDFPSESYYAYGTREGIPAMLELFDRHGVKVTAFLVGRAVEAAPDLFRDLAHRGHELAGHGYEWGSNQAAMSLEEEDEFIAKTVAAVESATGVSPRGWNCFALRRSPNTLSLLRKHGFTYHIDDVSADDAFTVDVDGAPFAVVPYTFHMNDLMMYEFQGLSTADWADTARREFDELRRSAQSRRRLMTISCHDRVISRPARRQALSEFLDYAGQYEDVWFATRGELAQAALDST
jgi:peptidoglycan/xylan/chitin deacetylase (PgdA/CDA1 family)